MTSPADLQELPDHQHARDAKAGGEPATAKVGDDARQLVEHEQEKPA